MAGPSVLILGPYAFEALGFAFRDLETGMETGWAEIKTAQGWDALQYLGPSKQTVSIKGVLHPEEFGGQAEKAGIEALAVSGVPVPLISLGGVVFGLFVVEDVDSRQDTFSGRGRARVDQYGIHLRRYPGITSGSVIGGAIRLFT
ncbi:oxidoreductase [Acuticoccus sediminis]|uniref:Oxidoreductase n=1 Tax=Acuticoccus sediminis TaxID=2184697 RepID=A0A8B2NS16_9HYPH|nr:phage tail protein [Acuticoccus sediminis]RAI01090.1 oxidoreductase [Acuticoccus sediminis]